MGPESGKNFKQPYSLSSKILFPNEIAVEVVELLTVSLPLVGNKCS
jgi:hypothetical protein